MSVSDLIDMIDREPARVSGTITPSIRLLLEKETAAAWIEDLSDVHRVVAEIPIREPHLLRGFFNEFPEELIRCRNLIRVTDANEPCLIFFGLDTIETFDQNLSRLFPLEALPSFREALVAFSEGKQEVDTRLFIQTLSGRQKEVRIHRKVLPGYQDVQKKILCTCHEIVPEVSCGHIFKSPILDIKTALKSFNVPIFAYRPDKIITFLNPPLTQLTGFSEGEIVGRETSFLFSGSEQAPIPNLFNQTSVKEPCQGMLIPISQKSGDQKTLLWNFIPITDEFGETTCTIAQGLDITGQQWVKDYLDRHVTKLSEKNIELEESRRHLIKINQTLDEKVRILSQEIEDLLIQKDEFINRIGHDLKTPLTPLMAILPVLLKKEQDPQKVAYLEMAIRNTGQAHDILISIIQMARMNTASLPGAVTELAVRQMIEEIIVNFEERILKTRIEVRNLVPDDLRVTMNPLDFDTIFGNLIDNAIKYTRSGGLITIDGQEGEGRIIIRCTDTGVGILPEERGHIFEKFYKADLSRHDGKSYGLGLSITKKIIERNGGTITVTSEGRNKGACFIVVVPVRKKGKT